MNVGIKQLGVWLQTTAGYRSCHLQRVSDKARIRSRMQCSCRDCFPWLQRQRTWKMLSLALVLLVPYHDDLAAELGSVLDGRGGGDDGEA